MRMQFLHDVYWKLYNFRWESYAKIAPKAATKSWYKMRNGSPLDLDNPKRFTEKLQYFKLNDYFRNPLITMCADKFAVRKYLEQKGCSELANELIGVYDSVDEIDWGGVPDKFVLKCNHGSGWNIVCTDITSFDIEEAKKKLSAWMAKDYGLDHVEYSYQGIPHKIICEKFIETEDGDLPKDYKIFCSYGDPKFFYVTGDRHGCDVTIDFYTPDWKPIPVNLNGFKNSPNPIPYPKDLPQLLKYASILSEDFPFVRVDLYCEFGKVIFGELTFLPTGGTFKFVPPEYDEIFGEMFPLTKPEGMGGEK